MFKSQVMIGMIGLTKDDRGFWRQRCLVFDRVRRFLRHGELAHGNQMKIGTKVTGTRYHEVTGLGALNMRTFPYFPHFQSERVLSNPCSQGVLIRLLWNKGFLGASSSSSSLIYSAHLILCPQVVVSLCSEDQFLFLAKAKTSHVMSYPLRLFIATSNVKQTCSLKRSLPSLSWLWKPCQTTFSDIQ